MAELQSELGKCNGKSIWTAGLEGYLCFTAL